MQPLSHGDSDGCHGIIERFSHRRRRRSRRLIRDRRLGAERAIDETKPFDVDQLDRERHGRHSSRRQHLVERDDLDAERRDAGGVGETDPGVARSAFSSARLT